MYKDIYTNWVSSEVEQPKKKYVTEIEYIIFGEACLPKDEYKLEKAVLEEFQFSNKERQKTCTLGLPEFKDEDSLKKL